MIKADEDALICDFAETYHIYDYKRLPVKLAASLAVGLQPDSRIKIKLSGSKVSPEMMMMAAIIDRLTVLVWMQTKDGQYGRNQPKPVLSIFEKPESDTISFLSGEDYEKERQRLLKKEAD
jgi:hypothetical protein